MLQLVQSLSRHLVALTACALAGLDQRYQTRVTFAEYRVLVLLATNRAETPSQLSAELNITRPAVAQILARLESAGLLRRRQVPSDRRSHRLVPTASGLRVVDIVIKKRERQLRPLLAGLTHQEQRKLIEALKRLEAAFDSIQGPSDIVKKAVK